MKITDLLLVAAFLINFQTLQAAEGERYVTASGPSSVLNTNNGYYTVTNTIEIADFEVGELISVEGSFGPASAEIVKNGLVFPARPASISASIPTTQTTTTRGTTVSGPATFRIYYNVSGNYSWSGAMMTVKITPLTYSPQKSVTVAPGMGNVQIEMESSTNLLTWAAATNGVYNDDLKFFRVKLTKLP